MTKNEDYGFSGISESKQKIIKREYPQNLLLSLEAPWGVECAENLTDDIKHGLTYAISLLSERTQEVLRLRYQERLSLSEIGDKFGRHRETIRQIEEKAVRKLRGSRCSTFIINGIVGTMEKIKKESYDEGYNKGYADGEQFAHEVAVTYGAIDIIKELPLEALCLSVTISRHLLSARCSTVGDVILMSEKDIKKIRRITTSDRIKISDALIKYGVKDTAWENLCYYARLEQNESQPPKQDDII